MAKIRNFDSFGAVLQHFCPDKREIWQGGRSPVPNFTFIGATCRPCGGKQSTFGPLSKKKYRHGCTSHRPAGNETKAWFRSPFAIQPGYESTSPGAHTEQVTVDSLLLYITLHFQE